jgi:hypothetical protein
MKTKKLKWRNLHDSYTLGSVFLLSYTLRYVSFTEVSRQRLSGGVSRTDFLCTYVNEERDDGGKLWKHSLCVLLPLENLLWVKLRDYAISRVNPNPWQVFLVRVVKM